jgi:hypothetical protein
MFMLLFVDFIIFFGWGGGGGLVEIGYSLNICNMFRGYIIYIYIYIYIRA